MQSLLLTARQTLLRRSLATAVKIPFVTLDTNNVRKSRKVIKARSSQNLPFVGIV